MEPVADQTPKKQNTKKIMQNVPQSSLSIQPFGVTDKIPVRKQCLSTTQKKRNLKFEVISGSESHSPKCEVNLTIMKSHSLEQKKL